MVKKNTAVLILRGAVALVTILGGAQLLIALGHQRLSYLPPDVLRVICVAEIASAVAFLIPRTIKLGGVALLVVYAAAATVHLLHGDLDISNLILLGAAVVVVLVD